MPVIKQSIVLVGSLINEPWPVREQKFKLAVKGSANALNSLPITIEDSLKPFINKKVKITVEEV